MIFGPVLVNTELLVTVTETGMIPITEQSTSPVLLMFMVSPLTVPVPVMLFWEQVAFGRTTPVKPE